MAPSPAGMRGAACVGPASCCYTEQECCTPQQRLLSMAAKVEPLFPFCRTRKVVHGYGLHVHGHMVNTIRFLLMPSRQQAC